MRKICMKTLTFLGDTLDQLREFPPAAQSMAGYQLGVVSWNPRKFRHGREASTGAD